MGIIFGEDDRIINPKLSTIISTLIRMFGENKRKEINASLINFCKTVYIPVIYGKKPCYIELLLMDSIFSKTPMGIGHAVIGVDIIEDSDSGKKVLMCKNSHGNELAYRIYDLNYAKLRMECGGLYFYHLYHPTESSGETEDQN